jgi:hypothetical protein
MDKRKASGHYADTVILDQCPSCGGIWLDDLELFRLDTKSADVVLPVDTLALRAIRGTSEEKDLSCPNDSGRLISFRDPNFPRTLLVESCPTCGGFWMNRSELAGYLSNRKDRIDAQRRTDTDETAFDSGIRKLLETHSVSAGYDKLGGLASFLSTPIDRMTLEPMPYVDETSRNRAGRTIDTAFSVLNILLRLFLRR